MLDATKKVNLKLREKCQLGVTELTFVGEIIISERIRPDPRNGSAVDNRTRPQSKKDVQRFSGMVNDTSKFIPNSSFMTHQETSRYQLMHDRVDTELFFYRNMRTFGNQ